MRQAARYGRYRVSSYAPATPSPVLMLAMPLSSCARAMPCPVLTLRMSLPESANAQVASPILLRVRYAMPGTDITYAAIAQRDASLADLWRLVCGTELGYGGVIDGTELLYGAIVDGTDKEYGASECYARATG
eukprot:2865588-Rhodomonas_salina.1